MTRRASEWIMDSGCTNHMTGNRSLLMDSTLCPSNKSQITFADTGKGKVLGLGRVAISKDQHLDKVMLEICPRGNNKSIIIFHCS